MKTIAVSTFLALICGAAVYVGVASRDAGGTHAPLSGQTSHDFGEVRYDGTVAELRHTFHLTNDSRDIINIVDTVSSCGCTVAEVSSTELDPGETVEIDITLKLTQAILRRETVWLRLGDGETVTLAVEALARRIQDFYSLQEAVFLRDEPEDIVLVATDLDTDVPPADPLVRVSTSSASAAFHGWQRVFRHDKAAGRPARWQGIVRVERSTTAQLPRDAHVTISISPEQLVQVNLTGRFWANWGS